MRNILIHRLLNRRPSKLVDKNLKYLYLQQEIAHNSVVGPSNML